MLGKQAVQQIFWHIRHLLFIQTGKPTSENKGRNERHPVEKRRFYPRTAKDGITTPATISTSACKIPDRYRFDGIVDYRSYYSRSGIFIFKNELLYLIGYGFVFSNNSIPDGELL